MPPISHPSIPACSLPPLLLGTPPIRPSKAIFFSAVLAASISPAVFCRAQAGPLDQPARNWAVEAAKNEVSVVEYNGIYLRYRVHIVNAKGDQVRDVIESRDGTVARLIYKENRSLTVDEDSAERERLQGMLDSPSAFAKHIKSDQTGKKLAVDLIKLMPDAMLYDYTPGQPQRQRPDVAPGTPPEIVLDFKPNPQWNPPTMTSEALTGLQGRIWIDARTHYLTRMEGEVFRGVSLGWGMVAHINPGGKVMLEQVDVPISRPDQRWLFSHFVERVSLRALMVKNITENSQIDSSEISRVPPQSYQDAIKTLLQTPLPH